MSNLWFREKQITDFGQKMLDMASYEARISKFSKLEPFQLIQQKHLVQSCGLHCYAYNNLLECQ